jgi:hypothetical protein
MRDGGGALTSDESAELRDLRRRAYAVDGDIERDPAALARLSELEAAARPTAALTVAESAAEPLAVPLAEPAEDSAESIAEPTDEPTAPLVGERTRTRTRARRRPRLVLVWAATLVAALVVGAAATWGSVRLVARAGGADQVAVLEEDPSFEMPPMFDDVRTEDVVGYRDFYGITAVTGVGTLLGSGSETDACLLLMRTVDVDRESIGWSGMSYGCGVGEFAATAQFRVDLSSPKELRERFADGTPLQFVFDGERLGVYVGRAPEPADPPRDDA